jgi:hypothetical protein
VLSAKVYLQPTPVLGRVSEGMEKRCLECLPQGVVITIAIALTPCLPNASFRGDAEQREATTAAS